MKKYVEILEEIRQARAGMKDTAKTKKEMDRIHLLEVKHNGTPEEFEKARSEYKAAEARYIEEYKHNNNIKIAIEILKDNAKQALFAELIAPICEIWNKYEGKAHGEKTSEKIRQELKTVTGYYISISNRWRDARIAVYLPNDTPAPFRDLEICPVWNGNDQPALDSHNKIVKLNPESFRVYCCGEYVDNVPEHVEKIRKAHETAKVAEKALEDAVSAYNALTRGNIQHASKYEGVKSWIF